MIGAYRQKVAFQDSTQGLATEMPSPLSRKKKNTKKGITWQRSFKPALKALNSLEGELENSENPEDEVITSERYKRKPSSASPDVTSYIRKSNTEECSKNPSVSPQSFFQRNGFLEEFGSDSESEDNPEDSVEERTKVRALTEVERLEEAQTALEDRVRHVKELLQRQDRTRNQRLQGQRTLERLEAKLEMLDQRLEYERAGKNQWTFVKRVLRKPKVGFHSSELLNRKLPLGLLAASMADTESELAGGVYEEQECKREEPESEDNPPTPPKPKKMFKTKALQEFHLNLEENVEAGSSKDGINKIESGGELEESTLINDGSDRKEMDKGWLRISDRPKDFIKRIDVSETHQSKEAWVNINEKGHQIFARKVFRSQTHGNEPSPSRSLDRGSSSNVGQNGKLNISDTKESNSLSETGFGIKDKERVGRISSSRPQRTQSSSRSQRAHSSFRSQPEQIVTMASIVGTTSFLPPIPKSEAKRRPKQEQVEKMKDENDEEQKKERMILIPNRKRVAKRRTEMYLKQLEFVKSHGLDQKEVLKKVGSAIQEHHEEEEELQEHEAKTTPRNTLYLIGALSRDHLCPPTAPSLSS